MSAQVQWTGLNELRTALRQLPRELTGDAFDIVEDTAETVASSLRQSYPIGDTGNLRKGVSVQTFEGRDQGFGVRAVVLSRAKHAHLWEFGTQSRSTKRGWFRGKMPAHKAEGLIPIAQRARRLMFQRLVDLVKRAGFQVSGG